MDNLSLSIVYLLKVLLHTFLVINKKLREVIFYGKYEND